MQCAGDQTGWVLLHHRVTHSSMFPVFVCTHELHVRQWWEDRGLVQSLEVLKKSWHLPSNFPDLEKVWKMEIKSGKMLFFQATASALHFISEIFVVLVKSYSISPVRLQRIMKWKALFLRFFFKVYIDHLFDNLESGKRSHCFEITVWKNSWILKPKNCTNLEDIMAARAEPEQWVSLYVFGKLLTHPFPRPTFCPKWEVSVKVGLGEG